MITSISIFGLDGTLFNGGSSNLDSLDVNQDVLQILRNNIKDPASAIGIISGRDAKDTHKVNMWLAKTLALSSSSHHLHLFLRQSAMTETKSAVSYFSMFVNRYRRCNRVYCIDSNPMLLKSYRDVLVRNNKPLWRLLLVSNGIIHEFDHSFVDTYVR